MRLAVVFRMACFADHNVDSEWADHMEDEIPMLVRRWHGCHLSCTNDAAALYRDPTQSGLDFDPQHSLTRTEVRTRRPRLFLGSACAVSWEAGDRRSNVVWPGCHS